MSKCPLSGEAHQTVEGKIQEVRSKMEIKNTEVRLTYR